jgi:aspartyl-tRNA(Asn)/glutamyl-tRNA(Gln) amidotransferase subunit C
VPFQGTQSATAPIFEIKGNRCQITRLRFSEATLNQLETFGLKRENHSMAEPQFDIHYVAHLARLSLSPEEEKKLSAQLGNILGYIEKLKELDVSNVEPTAHAVPLVNVTRADEIRESLSNDDALRNAPARANGLFMVPKIVE